MYAANSVAAGGDYASGGNVTTMAHTCWTMSPEGKEMFVLYGAVAGQDHSRRFARRVLFLDRMEVQPDGTLWAHSPTVTPSLILTAALDSANKFGIK